MGEDYEHIWNTILPEAHHVALCRLYHLPKFLGDAKGRREQYFSTVSESPELLKRVLQREPSEQDVVSWIAFVLGKDRTFLPFVSTHGGTAEALDPEKWRSLLEAGARAIVGEYLIARQNGSIT